MKKNNSLFTRKFILNAILFLGAFLPIELQARRRYRHNNRTMTAVQNQPQQARSVPCEPSSKRILIFDLGNTLFRIDKIGMARDIGLGDFIAYPLLEWKNPGKIEDKVFQVLYGLKEGDHGHCSMTSKGKPVPPIMCDWLAGKEKGPNIIQRAHAHVSHLSSQGFFASPLEHRLVSKTIDAIFNPAIVAAHMKPIEKCCKILERCSRAVDAHGRPLYDLYVISNLDPVLFNHLYCSNRSKRVFNYFAQNRLVISGKIGMLKPDPSIFSYFLRTYNLQPQSCIFIDDQAENVAAAKAQGMTGVVFKNPRQLERDLKLLKVL